MSSRAVMPNLPAAAHAASLVPRGSAVYRTPAGIQVAADSMDVLRRLDDESVDLVMTSPPFALLRKKAYGNEDQSEYVEWLAEFGKEVLRVLKPSGSLVLDLGGAYNRGIPTRSLYQFRVLLKFVDDIGFHLAEEFYWFNPAKLPSPIEWVNKRRIRVKDAVNCVWWLSKTPDPKADVNRVLKPYSKRMRKLLDNPSDFYDPRARPSEHDISDRFATDNGGAIPPNLLEIPNTDSNSTYLRTCRAMGLKSHPARFPEGLPRFFIRFLTDPGDLVVDIFAGSNTTGMVAEGEGRAWLSIELDRTYAALSAVRFLDTSDPSKVARQVERMASGGSMSIPGSSAT